MRPWNRLLVSSGGGPLDPPSPSATYKPQGGFPISRSEIAQPPPSPFPTERRTVINFRDRAINTRQSEELARGLTEPGTARVGPLLYKPMVIASICPRVLPMALIRIPMSADDRLKIPAWCGSIPGRGRWYAAHQALPYGRCK